MPGLILLGIATPTDDVVVLSIIPWLSSWLGSSSEQQMLNTLVTLFERLVNKRPSKIAFFVPSDGVAEERL